ncbi:MAG TPA: peptide deformylase [Candidatus Absconditabacterales bacterium]|nr:peptide deformylase [Candidatus Absconditabacterales bacterium]
MSSQKYVLQTGKDNPILRSVAKPIEKVSKDIKTIGLDLLDLMRDFDGVGLAAPQVGLNIRLIATTQWKKKGKQLDLLGEQIMINPTIIAKSEKMIIEEEACLSLPGITGQVLRHEEIKVSYLDISGKQQTKKFKGFDSVIIQHEVDHLDGILFIDKML